MKDWDDYTEKEQLLQYISDTYKSAYGHRPRGFYDDWSVEDLKVELDRLVDYANKVYEEEQVAAEKDADAFDEQILAVQASGAANREQAIKWLVEAEEDALYDIEHFVWKQGFLFTDRGRALVKEIADLFKAA